MGRPTLRRAWMPVLLSLVACGGGEVPSDGPTASVRDSAGVEIVTIDPSLLDADESVEVGREVLFEIGSFDGPVDDQLYRVTDVAWLGDDRILVANNRTEIRVYDLSGDLVRTLGGEGQGPGEFQYITALDVDDRGLIAVADFPRSTITVLDSLGTEVATVRPPGFFPFEGHLIDDRWWVGMLGGVSSPDAVRPERQIDSVLAVDLETGGMHTWIRVPGSYIHWESSFAGERRAEAKIYSPSPSVAIRDPVIVTTTGERYEYREWEVGGALRRIVRADVPAGEVTEAMRERVREQHEERAADLPPRLKQVAVFHDSTAVVTAIRRDGAGRTWVRRRDSEPLTWDVFAPDGQFLTRATWPRGFLLRDIGRDRVLGMRVDSLGVEYVQVRALGALPGG